MSDKYTQKRTLNYTNVCVVGGAGFLGSHMVDHLLDRGCRVLVVDNLISGRLEFVNKRAAFEHADITTSESYLLRLFQKYGIRYVFNYAAEPYVPVSFERPLHVFATNATGALNVMSAAHEAGCHGILQVSSAEIYGSGAGPAIEDEYKMSVKDVGECVITGDFQTPVRKIMPRISEDAPVCPHSSYGASKAAADAMVQVRWREAKVPAIALRQFNCVGERETHPYVVPEIISQISRQMGKRTQAELDAAIGGLPHPGNGIWVALGNNSSRDFQYAGDAVAMAVSLMEYGDFGEVYNMGSEQPISIYSLASVIGNIMTGSDRGVEVVRDEQRCRPWEIWHLCSDNTKLYRTIPVRPQVTAHAALERAIRCFERNGRRWCWEK